MTVQPLAWALLVAAVGKIEELLSTLRADTGSCPFSGARALSFSLGGARISRAFVLNLCFCISPNNFGAWRGSGIRDSFIWAELIFTNQMVSSRDFYVCTV